MESIFSLIIFFVIIGRIFSKLGVKGSDLAKSKQVQEIKNKYQQALEIQSAAHTSQTASQESKQRVMTQQDRAKLNAYKKKKGQMMEAQAATPNIVDRAKNNTAKYQKDTTMEQLEQQHGHSERMHNTGAKEYLATQKEAHPHDAMHVAKELAAQEGMLLGAVEDLMVKGYDGNLSFERDFVGEGLDMINSYQLPSVKLPDVL